MTKKKIRSISKSCKDWIGNHSLLIWYLLICFMLAVIYAMSMNAYRSKKIGIGELLTLVITSVTALVIVMYTMETSKIRRIDLRRYDNETMPYIRLQWSSKSD